LGVRGRAHVAGPDGPRPFALGAGAIAILLLAGCGGGSRQDASEKSANYQVKVVAARFPAKQSIAHPERMVLFVRNTGSSTVPNVAITVDSFDYASNYPDLAANKRPIWVIEQGPGAIARPPVESEEVSLPGGGQTAYVNTWALGPLPAGKTQRFIWKVTPVKSGPHLVSYTVSAGLAGKAHAELAGGGPVKGHFLVNIAGTPPQSFVDPKTGKVVTGVYAAPGAATP
jgi:hypothetical protein